MLEEMWKQWCDCIHSMHHFLGISVTLVKTIDAFKKMEDQNNITVKYNIDKEWYNQDFGATILTYQCCQAITTKNRDKKQFLNIKRGLSERWSHSFKRNLK